MKEISIEQKAQRYDEALKKAKEWFNAEKPDSYTCIIESIFPELKESEDERIRKEILDCFRAMKQQGCFPSKHKEQYDSWIAWLEKQGEQKPVWGEEDEKLIKTSITFLADYAAKGYENAVECIAWLKSLKPQKQWKPSDEQIKVCKEVYADILSTKGFNLGTVNSELNRLEEQLKKL